MAVPSLKISLFILLSLLQGILCQSVDISPKHLIANVGDTVTVMCKVDRIIEYCRFVLSDGKGKGFSVGPSKPAMNNIAYSGNGFDKGDCGMTLSRAEEKHNGFVNCTIGTADTSEELFGSMRLVIARTPSAPELQISDFTKKMYTEGEYLQATCTVKNGRPVANITWYINDTILSDGVNDLVVSTKDDLHTRIQNVSHKIVASDDGKMLKCVASHPGLTDPRNFAQQLISVHYKPKPIANPIEHFGLVEGAQGRIPVMVEANPPPKFIWHVGSKTLYEGEQDERYFVERTVNQGNGSWESVLVIDTLTKDDVEQDYSLRVENSLGGDTYKVSISTSPKPEVLEVGAGTIIIIVLAILLLAIVIATVLFARSRGKWCFAGGDAEKEISPSEGTENPAVTHHGSTEYIGNSPELKKEKPKEDTPV